MKLKEARICIDCDEVFEGWACPKCGSEQVVYLNAWLLPPEEKERYFGFLGHFDRLRAGGE